MKKEEITFEDVKPYQKLFTSIPAFLLERMAKKNSNVVKKFEPAVKSRLSSLNDGQKHKLGIVLQSDVSELQEVMNEAYEKTNKKQFKILANPKYGEFVEFNLDEIRRLI